jgi:predicted Rossmann fold flavoprotein
MTQYDGIVIGGGPAGMFAAITAAQRGQKVLLLERNDRLGKKLLITGKGRCNVTNNCPVDEVLKNVPRNGRFLYSALNAFPPDRIMDFCATNGCPLKTERGNRVFPVSDRSQSVLDALQRSMRQFGVTVRTDRVWKILAEDGAVCGVRGQNATYGCHWVILATGGLSYPTTGSTGDGYAMAEALGHTIVPAQGSLVPLETEGSDAPDMQGLSLRNVEVKLLDAKGKKLFTDFGELLFTHFGVSGPTVLSASAHLKGENCRLVIDLKPALDEGKLDARILRDLEMYKNRSMENALTYLPPRSMIPVVLHRFDIDP